MDHPLFPVKVQTQSASFDGNWTAEQIEAGLAGEPRIEYHEAWYEPTDDGFQEVTDPVRIQELEDKIKK